MGAQIYPFWVYLLIGVGMLAGVAIALIGLFTNTFIQPGRDDWKVRLKKRPDD